MPLFALLLGSGLIGAGLWLKHENTEQARLEVERLKIQPAPQPAAEADWADAVLPASLALAIASGFLILRG